MSSSAAEFSGSVPAFYDRYLGPVLFEPYAADLVSRLPTGDGLRVLEIACGTGIVTRRLQEALPDSAIVATDLNEPMTDYARAAVPAPGIIWQQADAQALAFDDGSFDLVVCQFGFMFLPDKVQGFREARRVLRSEGGVLLANVWHSMEANPPAGAIHASLARLFPADPPRFMETPYGYHDAERIRADMVEAGWKDVQLEDVCLQGLGPSAADFANGFTLGSPLAHELAERGANPDEVARALTDALIPVGGERPFKPSLAAAVINAVR